MTIFLGLFYALYFTVIGYGLRVAFNLLTRDPLIIDNKTDFFAHAFFQGVFFHVVIFNGLQVLKSSNVMALIFIAVVLLCCLALIGWHLFKQDLKSHPFKPSMHQILVITFILIGSVFIYWNGLLLPNIAWDSWAVWEGKAQQWLDHGLNAQIVEWGQWINNEQAVFNPSADYPDGLSLIYFLPKLLFVDGFGTTHVIYLIAFALMTLLLTNRLSKLHAPGYLQVFMVLVLYSTPFISNHLMIQGYADIWLAMFILLIMLSLMDYVDDGHKDRGLSVICYLAILPMLKLEGWVWLSLFVAAFLLVLLSRYRYKQRIYLAIAGIMLLLIALGGIHISLPAGDLIINHERIVVFNLLDTQLKFINITDQLFTSFFWQNNWSFIWLGLPFLLYSFFNREHSRSIQVSQVFLVLALLGFLFLFYFTEASQWAIDLTAINRIVLQLTPGYLFLLFKMLARMDGIQVQETRTKHRPAQAQ